MRHRFQKSLFPQSTLQSENWVFKFIHFGERFQKCPWQKRCLCVDTRPNREKKMHFQTKNISVDKDLGFDKAERYHKKHLSIYLW